MIRRHPALSVVSIIYFTSLAALCLTPNNLLARGTVGARRLLPWASASGVEIAVGMLLFVPMGVLLVLITGRRRWFGVLVVGVIACCWLRLAAMVWLPRQQVAAESVVPHIAGTMVGIALAVTLLALRRRPAAQVAAVPQRS